ncbi:hypothetical protein KJ785_01760 [Patescibacteria group bacterium]|nr:hypothetical protein [Patescibacteria group bacterium]
MPTNVPIDRHFIPLTLSVLRGLGNKLEGTLIEVMAPGENWEGWVLQPRGNYQMSHLYTHPTLFAYAAERAQTVYHSYDVQVWEEGTKLRLNFMSSDFGSLLDDTPTFEAEFPMITNVPLPLVLKLIQLTQDSSSHCIMASDCDGAKNRQLETERAVLLLDNNFWYVVMCRHCYKKGLPGGWKTLLCGWELPLRAPVSIWNDPSTNILW